MTVYDGAGNDTIDLSGYAMAQFLSLEQGVFSDIGGFVGRFSIAYGAVIENAVLLLTVNTSPPFAGDDPFALHRGLAPWGEGASNPAGNEGRGTAAEPGDATWWYREVPGVLWATAGGEFAAGPSATADIGPQGLAYAMSGAGMTGDVQQWLDDPASNFGWFLLGNESGIQTVRQFGSRESSDVDSRPTLFVSYSVVPEPAVVWLLGVGAAVLWLRRRMVSRIP